MVHILAISTKTKTSVIQHISKIQDKNSEKKRHDFSPPSTHVNSQPHRSVKFKLQIRLDKLDNNQIDEWLISLKRSQIHMHLVLTLGRKS